MSNNIQQFNLTQNAPDVTKAILWQYQNATNINRLMDEKGNWYLINYDEFWYQWFGNVFQLSTVNDFGVSVWAIILGLPINVAPPPYSGTVFGFDGPPTDTFDVVPFYPTPGSTTTLTLQQAVFALRLRCFQLFYRGTVTNINKFLYYLFDTANTGMSGWVLDNNNMTVEYHFNFVVPAWMAFIFDNFDLLPRPAGVGVSWATGVVDAFGFDGPPNYTFDVKPFGA